MVSYLTGPVRQIYSRYPHQVFDGRCKCAFQGHRSFKIIVTATGARGFLFTALDIWVIGFSLHDVYI